MPRPSPFEAPATRPAISTNSMTAGIVLADFENSESQSLLETVMTLAGMARFIIADVTDATMAREEIRSIVEKYPSKPIQPIMLYTEKEYVSLPEIAIGFKSIIFSTIG